MRTFLAYFQISFRNNTIYRIECLLGILNTCLQIFISCAIWKALYGANTEINGITFTMISTNFIISQGLANVFSLNDFAVQRKLHDGSISVELLKPVDLRFRLLAESIGEIAFKLLTNFLPSAIIASIFIGVLPPAGVEYIFLFLISVIFGFAILWAISTIVQMVSFWVINVWSVSTIKNVIINILAGSYIPLWFMPDKIIRLIKYTPFESIYFIPIKIYLGKINIADIWHFYAMQILWFVVLYGFGALLWQYGKKRIVVQGG